MRVCWGCSLPVGVLTEVLMPGCVQQVKLGACRGEGGAHTVSRVSVSCVASHASPHVPAHIHMQPAHMSQTTNNTHEKEEHMSKVQTHTWVLLFLCGVCPLPQHTHTTQGETEAPPAEARVSTPHVSRHAHPDPTLLLPVNPTPNNQPPN